jgi:hypothetical protein
MLVAVRKHLRLVLCAHLRSYGKRQRPRET